MAQCSIYASHGSAVLRMRESRLAESCMPQASPGACAWQQLWLLSGAEGSSALRTCIVFTYVLKMVLLDGLPDGYLSGAAILVIAGVRDWQ